MFFSAGLPISFTNIKTEASLVYKEFYEATGKKQPSFEGNLEVTGSKTFIGRGLDVENLI
jgi:hypothetical protein